MTRDEEIEEIRREPEFRALVDDLREQSPEQRERLHEWIQERAEREDKNDGRDQED